MKHILLFTALFLFSGVTAFAQSDAISKYFDKYVDDERFSTVFISPKMFEMLATAEIEVDDLDPDIVDILEELKGMKILSYDGEDARKFYGEAEKALPLNEYDELLTARDGGENVRIMTKTDGNIVSELLLLVGGNNEFALMSFVGNIDLKKVGKLGSMMNMHGTHHLEKIEKEE